MSTVFSIGIQHLWTNAVVFSLSVERIALLELFDDCVLDKASLG